MGYLFILLIGSVKFCSSLLNPIDLGHGLDSNTLAIPGFATFRYTKRTSGHWGGKNGPLYFANEFASSEHSGTSIITPGITQRKSTSVGNLPLSSLMTKAIFLDVSDEVGNNWNYSLPASKLTEWVNINGNIPSNAVLIIKFGWSTRYPIANLYQGPSNSDRRWPGLSPGAAQWIVDSGKIIGVGTDAVVITPGSNFMSNPIDDLILVNNNIYELDSLKLDQNLPPRFNILVMPMKLTDGVAAPTRVIAY